MIEPLCGSLFDTPRRPSIQELRRRTGAEQWLVFKPDPSARLAPRPVATSRPSGAIPGVTTLSPMTIQPAAPTHTETRHPKPLAVNDPRQDVSPKPKVALGPEHRQRDMSGLDDTRPVPSSSRRDLGHAHGRRGMIPPEERTEIPRMTDTAALAGQTSRVPDVMVDVEDRQNHKADKVVLQSQTTILTAPTVKQVVAPPSASRPSHLPDIQHDRSNEGDHLPQGRRERPKPLLRPPPLRSGTSDTALLTAPLRPPITLTLDPNLPGGSTAPPPRTAVEAKDMDVKRGFLRPFFLGRKKTQLPTKSDEPMKSSEEEKDVRAISAYLDPANLPRRAFASTPNEPLKVDSVVSIVETVTREAIPSQPRLADDTTHQSRRPHVVEDHGVEGVRVKASSPLRRGKEPQVAVRVERPPEQRSHLAVPSTSTNGSSSTLRTSSSVTNLRSTDGIGDKEDRRIRTVKSSEHLSSTPKQATNVTREGGHRERNNGDRPPEGGNHALGGRRVPREESSKDGSRRHRKVEVPEIGGSRDADHHRERTEERSRRSEESKENAEGDGGRKRKVVVLRETEEERARRKRREERRRRAEMSEDSHPSRDRRRIRQPTFFAKAFEGLPFGPDAPIVSLPNPVRQIRLIRAIRSSRWSNGWQTDGTSSQRRWWSLWH